MIGKLVLFGTIVLASVIFMADTHIMSFPTLVAIPHRLFLGSNVSGENQNTSSSLISSPAENQSSPQNNIPPNLDKINPQYVKNQTYVGQVFEKSQGNCKVSVPDLAETINDKKELTHIIDVKNCPLALNEPVKVTKLEAKPNIPIPVSSNSSISVYPYYMPNSNVALPYNSINSTGIFPYYNSTSNFLPAYYNILQLTSTQNGNDVLLNYDDTSGKTISVTVTLRNSDRVLFTGTFYASKFSTTVADVPNTDHIIDMTINHAVYGTLHASSFVPANTQNSSIAGIFTK